MKRDRASRLEKQQTIPLVDDVFTVLRALSPFKLFSDEELVEIVPLSEIRSFQEGVSILCEGDASNNCVYFLLNGGVEISINEKFILGLKRQGDIFGEMSLISDEPRSATVRASAISRLLVVNSALTFDPGQENYYKFRYYFSRMFSSILTDKLKMTSERAKMYETAVLQSREAEEQSTTFQQQIRENLLQITIYTHLVGSAKDTILIINTAGIVLEANPSLQTEFGISPKRLSGHSVAELLGLSQEGEGGWEKIVKKAREDGWSGEVNVRWKTMEPIPADCSISLIQDSNDDPLAFSVILRNIRQRKINEQKILAQSRELERANIELQKLDKLKDNFIGLISHELRTPLTSIISYAEMLTLEGMVEPEDQGDFLRTIHSESLQLAHLVNKMVAIYKIENGQMVFDFQEHPLDDLMLELVAAIKSRAEEKNIVFQVLEHPPLSPFWFDKSQIREALTEIFENSVLYTDKGGVEVSISQNDELTLIELADTGKGMTEEQIASAFNRFEIVKNVTYHQQGIGLGLPLAYLIVEAHGGEIRLHSTPEMGTTVMVSLPLQPPDSGRTI